MEVRCVGTGAWRVFVRSLGTLLINLVVDQTQYIERDFIAVHRCEHLPEPIVSPCFAPAQSQGVESFFRPEVYGKRQSGTELHGVSNYGCENLARFRVNVSAYAIFYSQPKTRISFVRKFEFFAENSFWIRVGCCRWTASWQLSS